VADPRRDEIVSGLTRVRARIAAGCLAVGRDPAEVTLIAVTKTYPVADIARLVQLGVTDIGENRDQEAAGKAAELAAAGVVVRWHFVGQLQRNKCRSVVTYADLVHSVDSVALARTLDREAQRGRDSPLDVLLQVSLDGDPERGGVVAGGAGSAAVADPDRDLDRVLAAVTGSAALRLRGVMAVAPSAWEPDRAFALLADVAVRVRTVEPAATIVSAGMSGDLEPALAHGATHVRVGGALLGKRPIVR